MIALRGFLAPCRLKSTAVSQSWEALQVTRDDFSPV